MSKLKILISSTCYDLGTIRAELRPFLKELGYQPVMSDYYDILYDPREHTHTSCIKEIGNCDMVIFIIGSRFGGKSVPSALQNINKIELQTASSKTTVLAKGGKLSITQVEILKAIELSIPIYTFVLNDVYHSHNVYEANKHKPGMKGMDFPSIQKNDTAAYIFEFINFIRGRKCNNSIVPFKDLSEIKEYLLGQWSQLFQRLLSEQSGTKEQDKKNNLGFNANIKIVHGAEGYLRLLANLIKKSEKEVLFTSTKMAGTSEEGIYGKLQKIIIKESIEFQKRNPKRLHYGIIDARSHETSTGAAELRAKVSDIVLRFNEELDSIKVNFFISDEEYVVLRMNRGVDEDRYSVLIQNKHLARILKRYFYSLWDKSKFMKKHLSDVVNGNEDTKEDIMSSAGLHKTTELIEFLDFLNDIDERNLMVPSKFLEKIIHANSSHYSKTNTQVFNRYLKYFKEEIKPQGIELSNLSEVKRRILFNQSIDYTESSHAFFVLYFLSNYFKAYHSLECLTNILKENSRLIKVLDIGGGGGASSTAIIDYILENKINIDLLDIIDRSDSQLKITKNVISHTPFNVIYHNEDAFDYLEHNNKYDLIFAGNFLCEANKEPKSENLPSMLKNLLVHPA